MSQTSKQEIKRNSKDSCAPSPQTVNLSYAFLPEGSENIHALAGLLTSLLPLPSQIQNSSGQKRTTAFFRFTVAGTVFDLHEIPF